MSRVAYLGNMRGAEVGGRAEMNFLFLPTSLRAPSFYLIGGQPPARAFAPFTRFLDGGTHHHGVQG